MIVILSCIDMIHDLIILNGFIGFWVLYLSTVHPTLVHRSILWIHICLPFQLVLFIDKLARCLVLFVVLVLFKHAVNLYDGSHWTLPWLHELKTKGTSVCETESVISQEESNARFLFFEIAMVCYLQNVCIGCCVFLITKFLFSIQAMFEAQLDNPAFLFRLPRKYVRVKPYENPNYCQL